MNLLLGTESLALRNILIKNSISITDIQLSLLCRYKEELVAWNTKVNLVSRRDQENVWMQHILLSLSLMFFISMKDDASVLDLGTGGGLPGIPLSIMCPGVRFVLLDSIRKKCDAVQDMVKGLKLSNVSVVCSRAENLGEVKNHITGYDAVIARSVASLDKLMKYSYPLLKPKMLKSGIRVNESKKLTQGQSCLVTLKGGELDKELSEGKRIFPSSVIEALPLKFKGSEILQNQDKKIVIVQF